MDITQIMNRGIFFCTKQEWTIQYVTKCIIQGLDDLGIPYSIGNYNLIDTTKAVCCVDLSLFTPDYYSTDTMKLGGLENFDMKLVVLSASDSNSFINVNVPFFATHELRDYVFEGRIRIPMAFGLSYEIINDSTKYNLNVKRESAFLSCHKRTRNQSVRDSAEFLIIPHFRKHMHIDNTMSDKEQYYYRLSKYEACLTYGGTFYSKPNCFEPIPGFHRKECVIIRWDNWKIWEAFAFECLVINLNFEKYGFQLPVMPIEGEHYLGIDLEDTKNSCERIMDLRHKWREIAIAGKKWAIKHYSPIAVAQRFINQLASL